MTINQIHIRNVRNLIDVSLQLNSSLNVLIGQNGSGKTSVLEGISLLTMGRSFRSRIFSKIINLDSKSLTIFANVTDVKTGRNHNLGFSRQKGVAKVRIKKDGVDISSISSIAKMLPVLLLNHDGYSLIESAPIYRRQYFDLIMFHVEPLFFTYWKKIQKIIKQRNAALKGLLDKKLIQSWDEKLVEYSLIITKMRQTIFTELAPFLHKVIKELLNIDCISFEFFQGWNSQKSLSSVLSDNLEKDRYLCYTTQGPHRFDILIKINKISVHDILSRGQKKLLFSALRLAQGMLISQKIGISPIYLVDDLNAELDEKKRFYLVDFLLNLESQIIMTGVSQSELAFLDSFPCNMFHVKQGRIEMDSLCE